MLTRFTWLSSVLAGCIALGCGADSPAHSSSGRGRLASDDWDAGVAAAQWFERDAGRPADAGAPEARRSRQGVDAGVTDAATDETPITESIVTERGVCDGIPLCGGTPCECGAGDAGCGGWFHCAQLNTESQCGAQAGCSWQIITEINEGTATGKRCVGEVGSCQEQTWECKRGCDESFEDGRRSCTGTPEPCSAKLYAADCERIWRCSWE